MGKKILEGWLDVHWGDTGLHPTKDLDCFPEERLYEQLEEFHGKKIRITIEEIEEEA